MKRILFFLLLVINLSAFGQVPSGYTKAGWRYKVKAFIFDSTLHIPSYNGTPSGIRTGGWVGDGAIGMDTTNHRMYIYSGGAWLRLAKYSEVATPTWQQTLTAGSTLTGNNTIDGGGFDFSFGDSRQFAVATTGASSYFYADASDAGKISLIRIRPDSIVIQPNLGQINIDTLQTASSQNTLIGWTSTSGANRGKVGAVSIGTGLSLSSGTLNSVWTASGNDVYNNNSGNVGIGTTSPDSTLTVIGGLRINNGAAQNNYVWTSTGTDGRGTWKAAAGNSVNLVFGGGSGASADTAVFTTSAIYGSFYNDADTIVVTSMRAVLQGTSPDVTYKVWYNDSLNVAAGATALVTAGSQVTNTTTGTNVTSFDVTKIPPGVWVWVKTSAVTTKPTYFSLTINAKR